MLLAAAAFFFYFQTSQRILPGVNVGGNSLGGMTVMQAATRLQGEWNMGRTILVEDGLQSVPVSPAALGLSIDPLATAQLAYMVGHNQNIFAELDQMIYSLQNGWGIAPLVNLDPQGARQGMETLSTQLSRAPQDAALQLQGTQLVAISGQLGYTVNIEETLTTLSADPRKVMITGRLKVSLMPLTPRLGDVSGAMAQAQQLLDTPLTIYAYDPIRDERMAWAVPKETLASWLIIENDQQGPVINVNAQKIAEFITQMSANLGPERWVDVSQVDLPTAEAIKNGNLATALIKHNPTVYTVEPGDTLIKVAWKVGMPYWRLIQANPGLDTNRLHTGQEIIVPSKDELLPLPIVPNKRIVINISQQRLRTYQDGALRSEEIISTGINRSPTQPGVFQVQTHELSAYASVWDLTMPHFLGIYEAWPGFMNGIHGLPTLSNGRRLWANILGQPASYGCIILNLEAAESLYQWAEDGVVVEIQP